jgi:hypothetical protein
VGHIHRGVKAGMRRPEAVLIVPRNIPFNSWSALNVTRPPAIRASSRAHCRPIWSRRWYACRARRRSVTIRPGIPSHAQRVGDICAETDVLQR